MDASADIDVVDRVNVSAEIPRRLGHGTFMAGLVAGDDADFGGVAGAQVFDAQVAMPDGSTTSPRVLAGLQQVADQLRPPTPRCRSRCSR